MSGEARLLEPSPAFSICYRKNAMCINNIHLISLYNIISLFFSGLHKLALLIAFHVNYAS